MAPYFIALFACLLNFDWMIDIANFTLLDSVFCFSTLHSCWTYFNTQLSYQKSIKVLLTQLSYQIPSGLFLRFVRMGPEQPLLWLI